jgi:Fic family protein
MDVTRFRESPIGSLVPISGYQADFEESFEHFAFVPHPLPTAVTLSQRTWRAVGDARSALGKLDQASRQVADPYLFRRPTLRREAQSTSALEGTYAPLVQVLEADPEQSDDQSPELAEVLNYVRAAEYAYKWIADGRPVTVGLLLSLHRTLVRGTSADGPEAGRVRQLQVVIGARGGRVRDARFVPPPPGLDLEASVTDWVDWLEHPPADVDPLVCAALAHYQFETLHPFNDGNGRIGRLAIVLQMLRHGLIQEPILTVSPWFEARRESYQDNLQRVSETGDWDQWVDFFATGIRAQAESTAQKVTDLLVYRDEARAKARAAKVKGLAIDIIEDLITFPVFTISTVASRRGVTPQATNAAVSRLVELDILREITGGRYARVFTAPGVMTILQT